MNGDIKYQRDPSHLLRDWCLMNVLHFRVVRRLDLWVEGKHDAHQIVDWKYLLEGDQCQMQVECPLGPKRET